MISTRSLTKDFVVSRSQTVHAVRSIDLEIAPGELVAVLGPNGAGKTTTTATSCPSRRRSTAWTGVPPGAAPISCWSDWT